MWNPGNWSSLYPCLESTPYQLQSEVGKLYRQYRDESDARKVLLAEYNDLKYKHQEQKGEEGGGATGETEDPVVLKLKLMWANQKLWLGRTSW